MAAQSADGGGRSDQGDAGVVRRCRCDGVAHCRCRVGTGARGAGHAPRRPSRCVDRWRSALPAVAGPLDPCAARRWAYRGGSPALRELRKDHGPPQAGWRSGTHVRRLRHTAQPEELRALRTHGTDRSSAVRWRYLLCLLQHGSGRRRTVRPVRPSPPPHDQARRRQPALRDVLVTSHPHLHRLRPEQTRLADHRRRPGLPRVLPPLPHSP